MSRLLAALPLVAVSLLAPPAAYANVTDCVLLDECEVEAPAPAVAKPAIKAPAPAKPTEPVASLTIIKGNVVSVATFPVVDRVCTAVIEGGSAPRYLNSLTHTYFADATSCAAAK